MGWLAAFGYCCLLVALAAVAAALLFRPSLYRPHNGAPASVQVVVMGDIGRSPRMQYHAISLAKKGFKVDIVGYKESEIHPLLEANSNVRIVPVPPWPKWLQTENRKLMPLVMLSKVIWQIPALAYAMLFLTPAAKYMLVQNPPAIPTLMVAQLACTLRNTTLAIDWHNYGSTILALKLGPAHPLVKLYNLYETTMTRGAAINFTVTTAMARSIRERELTSPIPTLLSPRQPRPVAPIPLYDRPPAHFQPCPSPTARRDGFAALAKKHDWPLPQRPYRVLVSSTSWTPDEDFSLLLSALRSYSSLATTTTTAQHQDLPHIVAIVTGKGPQRSTYLTRIAAMESASELSHATILTAWLPMTDYASLLSYADLGVSLHQSSSGVDLPMKVVDMFGAGLPVVGWAAFEAWGELVREGVNGRGFGSAGELTDCLVQLFTEEGVLDGLRAGAGTECERRWDDEWDEKAGKVFV